MTACFIGHRTLETTEELVSSLREAIVTLIVKGVTTFLFGSMSEFNSLAWKTVTQLRCNYPHIKRIYVRSTYRHISTSYEEHLLQSYEETYFPPKIANAGKYSYVERNYEMIDSSTYCVFYYNENYIAPSKRQSKRNVLPPPRHTGGTKIAYNYAMKKKKQIINLYVANCQE